MTSGIVLVVVGALCLAWSIYQFMMRKRYHGSVFAALALMCLVGGIILLLV